MRLPRKITTQANAVTGSGYCKIPLRNIPWPVNAAADGGADLSIEELANLQITSASKKPEPLAGAAASVFVFTADDIRRSGAAIVPEVLRLARRRARRAQSVFGQRMAAHPAPGVDGRLAHRARGIEMWGNYQATPAWRLSGGLTALHEQAWLEPGSNDLAIRKVGALSWPDVPGQVALDARFGWRLRKEGIVADDDAWRSVPAPPRTLCLNLARQLLGNAQVV